MKCRYPYIADKEMYAAVMGACSMIREMGYFHKAVSYYASRYGVDEDELAAHIRARQGVGQHGKQRGAYKNFRYAGRYDVFYKENADTPTTPFDMTLKALNERNARSSLYKKLLGPFDPYDYNVEIEFDIEGEIV